MVNGEITTIANKFKESLNPLRIYLFGSYARGDYNAQSDYDFYIIVPDENYDNIEQTNAAYCSLIGMKRKSVDIVVGNKSLFDRRKHLNSIEKIVAKEGVLLYVVNTCIHHA
ncbi:MAG: nucleotidyltransferase domain-containing protein [Treponema sp.]|nr:nucleotidyltransferase domain-containing protein [Treponema sp.]